MEPEVQAQILRNLQDLNTTVGAIGKGQEDIAERIDKIGVWVKTETEKNAEDIAGLQRWQSVTSWKIGSLAAGAGAVCSFAGQWLAVKLGFKLH